jgi:RHS repeat-associated protein
MAKANPFRFSTKYQEDETDLVYYGRRYYSTSSGSWSSRDPLEEQGGVNLYEFVGNEPLSRVDPHGLVDRVGDSVAGCHCCACVGALVIPPTSVFPFGGRGYGTGIYGHGFGVLIQLDWVVTKKFLVGVPELIWKEKSSRPPDNYEGKAKPEKWFDVYKELGKKFSMFDTWRQGRQKPSWCPISQDITIEDYPRADINLGPRTLEFEITVRSAPGCPCPFRSMTITAKQVLAGPESSPGTIRIQTFTVGQTTGS